MKWGPFVGDTTYAAHGRNAVYLVLDEGESAKVYQMNPDLPLCPINPERALRYAEVPPCSCGECEGQGITAALGAIAIAEKWEEDDSDEPGETVGTPEPDCGAAARD